MMHKQPAPRRRWPSLVALATMICAEAAFAAPRHASPDGAGTERHDTSAPLAHDATTTAAADASPSFRWTSSDGRAHITLNVLAAATLKWQTPLDDQPKVLPVAAMRLARVQLVGDLLDDRVRWWLQPEFAGTPKLLDLEFDLRLSRQLTLRLGRFRTPTTRQWMAPLGAMQLPDRSVVSDFFRADRSNGAALAGTFVDGLLELQLGAFVPSDRALLLTARVAIDPFGVFPFDETLALSPGPTRLSVALSGHSSRASAATASEPTGATGASGGALGGLGGLGGLAGAPTPTPRDVVGVDFAFRAGAFAAFAEVDLARPTGVGPADLGATAQGGLYVVPGRVEVAARVTLLQRERDVLAESSLLRGELATTLMLLPRHLKLQLRATGTRIRGAPIFANNPGVGVDGQILLAL